MCRNNPNACVVIALAISIAVQVANATVYNAACVPGAQSDCGATGHAACATGVGDGTCIHCLGDASITQYFCDYAEGHTCEESGFGQDCGDRVVGTCQPLPGQPNVIVCVAAGPIGDCPPIYSCGA